MTSLVLLEGVVRRALEVAAVEVADIVPLSCVLTPVHCKMPLLRRSKHATWPVTFERLFLRMRPIVDHEQVLRKCSVVTCTTFEWPFVHMDLANMYVQRLACSASKVARGAVKRLRMNT